MEPSSSLSDRDLEKPWEEDGDFWRASPLGANFWRLKGLEVKLKWNQASKGKKSPHVHKKLVFIVWGRNQS